MEGVDVAYEILLCAFEKLINMADSRNETSHKYSIESVRLILPNIPKYYFCMITILKRLDLEKKQQ